MSEERCEVTYILPNGSEINCERRLRETESKCSFHLDLEELFDALPATSQAEISERTDWTIDKIGRVLASIRNPDNAKAEGWTVPHAQRGGQSDTEHLFRAKLVGEAEIMNVEELTALKLGATSTLSTVATEGRNESFALKEVSTSISDPTLKKSFRRLASVLDAASDMAADLIEKLREANGF